jgi:hypothetical protein
VSPDRDEERREEQREEERRERREEERREERRRLTPADKAFARALDAALDHRSWKELRIDAECQHEGERWRTIRLYGSGVAIWNHGRQFTVPRERLLDLLAQIDRAGFARIAEPPVEEEEEGEGEGLEMSCGMLVVLDGTEKRAQVLEEEDEESEELESLVERVLAVGESLGASGAAAASLEEGLEKIARGELPPEVLSLHLLRQPEGSHPGESGWMLRVEGGDARLSRISPGTGWTLPQRIHLSPAEVADLARTLADARPDDLPVNLYSSWYEDLRIEVLGHAKSIQARQFARMTPETQGEKQERFDRLGKALEALAARFQPGAP